MKILPISRWREGHNSRSLNTSHQQLHWSCTCKLESYLDELKNLDPEGRDPSNQHPMVMGLQKCMDLLTKGNRVTPSSSFTITTPCKIEPIFLNAQNGERENRVYLYGLESNRRASILGTPLKPGIWCQVAILELEKCQEVTHEVKYPPFFGRVPRRTNSWATTAEVAATHFESYDVRTRAQHQATI